MIGGMLVIGDICTIVTLELGTVPCFASGVGGGTALGAGVGASGGYIFVSNKDDIIGKYKYEVLQAGKISLITFEQFPDISYAVSEK